MRSPVVRPVGLALEDTVAKPVEVGAMKFRDEARGQFGQSLVVDRIVGEIFRFLRVGFQVE